MQEERAIVNRENATDRQTKKTLTPVEDGDDHFCGLVKHTWKYRK